jgi:hypothetical protein
MKISGVQSVNFNDVYFPIFSKGFAEVVADDSATQTLPGEQEVSYNCKNIVYFISGSAQEDSTTVADNAVATARQFILSKLPSLGIEIDDEPDLHTETC